MSQDKESRRKKQGFGSASEEEKKRRLEKSLATRRKNKVEREQKAKDAKKLRDKANEFRKEAEKLDQEADALDGQNSSEKNRKKYEAELAENITVTFGKTVSAQYLKQMIQHAILRNLTVDQIVTPTMAAMDILNDPQSSTSERKEAMKMLQNFESAKPAIAEEVNEGIRSAQEELDALMAKHGEVAPKR